MRQIDLASKAGLSWRHLIRIEQGEGGDAKRETLDRIAEALGVERSELTGADDDDEETDLPAALDAMLRSYLQKLIREEVRA